MSETIFDKILAGEIPADVVHETDEVLAFRDIAPQAPVHVLVIPKRRIAKLGDAQVEDAALLGQLMVAARVVAEKEGVGDAFRVVVNSGEGAQQTVFHLHLHVLGGRPFTWPPG